MIISPICIQRHPKANANAMSKSTKIYAKSKDIRSFIPLFISFPM